MIALSVEKLLICYTDIDPKTIFFLGGGGRVCNLKINNIFQYHTQKKTECKDFCRSKLKQNEDTCILVAIFVQPNNLLSGSSLQLVSWVLMNMNNYMYMYAWTVDLRKLKMHFYCTRTA